MKSKLTIVALAAVMSVSMTAAAKKQTINFWHSWGGDSGFGAGMKALVKAFNESQNNVEVKITVVGSLEEKLLIAMAGGSGPDVSMFDRFMLSQWGNVNGFITLDPYMRRDNITAAQYNKACWNEARVNGSMQAMPFNTDVRLLFYNKTLFTKFGFDPQTPPARWNQLDDIAVKFAKTAPGSTRLDTLGFVPYLNEGWPYIYLFQNGVEFFNSNNSKVTFNTQPAAAEALEWEANLVERQGGYAAVNAVAGGMFERGKLGCIIDGDWSIINYTTKAKKLDFGVSFPPYNKVKTTWSGGHSLVISKFSKHKDAAWQFVKFAGSKQGQLVFSKVAYTIPANRAAATEMAKGAGMDKRWAFAVDQLDDSTYRPQSLVAKEMWDELNNAGNLVIQRKMSAKNALDNAAKKLQLSLDKKSARRK